MTKDSKGSRKLSVLTRLGSLTVLASLSLMLHQLPEAAGAQEPRGIPVFLMRNCTEQEERQQGDGQSFWVRLRSGGGVDLNLEQIKPESLVSNMSHIFETRAERALYLIGDEEVSYGRVARTAADLHYAIPDLSIFLLTSSNMRSAGHPCLTFADPQGWGAPLRWRPFATMPPFD